MGLTKKTTISFDFYNNIYKITIAKENKLYLYLNGTRLSLIEHLYYPAFYNAFVDALSSIGYYIAISDHGLKAITE